MSDTGTKRSLELALACDGRAAAVGPIEGHYKRAKLHLVL
jgi:hypothetical protein